MQPETKTCQNCKQDFVIEPDDFAFYEKMKVPPPTWCPECRMIRRFLFRNERILFRRKESLSGKDIFSVLPPEANFTVYERDYWWSDNWDPMDYGRDYDFSRPFFEQFDGLYRKVPKKARNVVNLINSDYSANIANAKNCYLCFNLDFAEDSAYLVNAYHSKNCFDITASFQGELNYDSIVANECFKTFFSFACEGCQNVWFSRNCTSCSDCFGCTNLRAKQYHIFNQPYSKEEYFEKLREFNLGSYTSVKKIRDNIEKAWISSPYKFMLGWQNVDVSGDWIANSKNVKYSFKILAAENLKYCQDIISPEAKDSYDYTIWGDHAEQIYEAIEVGWGARQIKFSEDCWPAVEEIEYSVSCHSSSYLFGCVGLRQKSYCILNKQYSKEGYFALRENIIQHMDEMPYKDKKGKIYRYGEFFPSEFSQLAYNETIAQDFFPLTKEQAAAKGYMWRDPKPQEYQITTEANNLPDHISDAREDIIKEVIKCSSCGRAYRIIQAELDFLRQMSLPLPRLCVDCRFNARIKHYNLPRFYDRFCQCRGLISDNGIYQNKADHFHGSSKCPNEFETSYAPERQEIVYCESCYQSEIL